VCSGVFSCYLSSYPFATTRIVPSQPAPGSGWTRETAATPPSNHREARVNKIIALLAILAVTFLEGSFFGPLRADTFSQDEKPTFYRLIPGIYVNGWPRFTFTYPKDWVERHPMPQETFRVSAPGSVPFPALVVAPFHVGLAPQPSLSLETYSVNLANALRAEFTDVTVVSDKPSRLRDGTPAREAKLRMLRNGAPFNVMGLLAKKGDMWINMAVESLNGEIGDDLKAILYSIEFQPEKDKRVEVPADVQEFLAKYNSDVVSHDVAKVMSHYSDRYLSSGNKKEEVEWVFKQYIGYWMSQDTVITDFKAADDRTYLTGFVVRGPVTMPISESIVKENGEWKWCGNQRNPAP
jgi:hypothetical protein